MSKSVFQVEVGKTTIFIVASDMAKALETWRVIQEGAKKRATKRNPYVGGSEVDAIRRLGEVTDG